MLLRGLKANCVDAQRGTSKVLERDRAGIRSIAAEAELSLWECIGVTASPLKCLTRQERLSLFSLSNSLSVGLFHLSLKNGDGVTHFLPGSLTVSVFFTPLPIFHCQSCVCFSPSSPSPVRRPNSSAIQQFLVGFCEVGREALLV